MAKMSDVMCQLHDIGAQDYMASEVAGPKTTLAFVQVESFEVIH